MYYSYYKSIAESKDFFDGMEKLNRDNLSEYGNVIDATKKYSLLPEVTEQLIKSLRCDLQFARCILRLGRRYIDNDYFFLYHGY
jgi:hypothetical protein